jgi:KDO2-lipid IV(A) lauroyltransferase
VLIDRPVTTGDGVTVKMFGRDTILPAGAAALAGMARCPIIPGYLRRRADGRFEGGILPAIEPVRTGNREEDLAATMQQVVAGFETVIRRSPHQWYMFRDMWPTASSVGKSPGWNVAPRLAYLNSPVGRFGSLALAAWCAGRLPIVRWAWKAVV